VFLAVGLAAVHWRAFRGWVIADRDAGRIFFPDSAFMQRCLRGGELPLWQPYAFLGSSFVGSLQAQLFYPPRVLAVLLFGPYWSLTLLQVFHAGVAAVGAYRLARALGRSAEAGALCAVAFGLSPVLADMATTPNLVHAAAWAPWVVLAARRRAVVGLAGFLAMALLAGSPEMVLWELGLVALVAVRRRTWARVLGGVAWGGALAAAALLPAAEAAMASARGTARVDPLDWSASWKQLLAMAWPLADMPRGPYWGEDQWLLIQVFAGTVVVALAVVGARRSKPFAVGGVLFALLALGRAFPPAAWLLTRPPLSMFRYPAKYLVGVLFCLAVLAAFGLDALAAWRHSRRLRRALLVVAVTELALFHAAQVGHGWAPIGDVSRPAALASFIDPLGSRISVPIGRRSDSANVLVELSREPTEGLLASRQMLVSNRFAEDGLRALEGYGAPEPARIFDFQLSGQRAVADLAGVRVFVRPTPPFHDVRSVAALPGDLFAYESQTAFPRAWVVPRGTVAGDREVLDALTRGSALFREDALLASGPPLHATPCPDDFARVTAEACRSIDVEASVCPEGGFLVLGDAYDPGWRVEVDGQPGAPLLRADYALRAVRLTGGVHRVRMTYSPWTFWLGLLISTLALATIALTCTFLRPRRPSAGSSSGSSAA